MQVSVEQTSEIERRLTVSVPSAEVGQEIDKRLRAMGKNARFKGFRPGKAPANLIQQRYGAQVANEVVRAAIQSSYREALEREKIEPAGLVSIKPETYVAGKDLQYVATVELYPKIPKASLAGRKLEKPVCTIGKEDVERTLESIRARSAEFKARAKGAKAAAGDRVTIDLRGELKGQLVEGSEAKGRYVVLGDSPLNDVPEPMRTPFLRELRGVAVGEEKRVGVSFAKDYAAAEVAGKKVEFVVVVKAVEEVVLPALDDAFAAKLGVAEGGLAKVRAQIKMNMQRELAERERTVVREMVLQELLAVNAFEPPKSMVEGEIDRQVQAVAEQQAGGKKGKAVDASGIERGQFTELAKRHVRLGLIVREIINTEKVEVDKDLVRARIEEIASGYNDREALVQWYYAEPSRLQEVEAMVLEEQVVGKMLATATVKEKKVGFQEFMGLGG